jgi:hypothetical protein
MSGLGVTQITGWKDGKIKMSHRDSYGGKPKIKKNELD